MSNDPITVDEFKQAMPPAMRKRVDQEVMDHVNNTIKDPEMLAVYRENIIGFTSVLKEGRFKIQDYLKAVKFVSYRLLGATQIQAWSKTFPDRYKDMGTAGYNASEIASVCSRYAKSKLVTLIMGQTLVPTHILNAPLHQKSINTLAELMLNAKNEKVRCDAASKLVDALKPPESQKIELDIGLKEDSSIAELRETTRALQQEQRRLIESGGYSVKSIAESKIIKGEVTAIDAEFEEVK